MAGQARRPGTPVVVWMIIGVVIAIVLWSALNVWSTGPMMGFPWFMGYGAFGGSLGAVIGLAILVLSVVVTVQAYQAKRSGWWIYLICIFIPPLGLAAVIAWFVHLKDNPTRLGGDITI